MAKRGLRNAVFGVALVVVFGTQAQDASEAGEKYALLISAGKSKFRETVLSQAVKSLIANDFKPDNITLLYADKATWENVERSVDELYERLSDKDMVALYVSGTGTLLDENDRKESVLFLWNNTAVRTSRLAQHLKSLSALSGFVFFDAPYGDAILDALKETPFATIAPSSDQDAVSCATFALVFWKELERSGKERSRKFLNSVEGAYRVAESHSKRRSAAKPVIRAGFDPEHFFLWLPPRDQKRVDDTLRLASGLVPDESAMPERGEEVAVGADAYDDLVAPSAPDAFEDEK
jgi:hypothetical protein